MRIVLFCHSLLSDWNHGNAHFLRGLVAELDARGHEVSVHEPCDAWSVENLVADHGPAALLRVRAVYPRLAPARYDLASFDLDAALRGADLVLVHEWTEPELVRRIGEHRRRRGGYRLFFHDTHHRMVTDPAAMAGYDLSAYDGVLAFGRALRDRYLERGLARRAWTWHEAADARVFRPLPGLLPERDLVWVGNWGDGERSRELHDYLIEPARALGLSARVHGVRYPAEARAALAAAGVEHAGWLPNFLVPDAFARARMTVHVPRGPYLARGLRGGEPRCAPEPPAPALPGVPTIRVFEALACGIPLVCAPWDDAEGLFSPGDDYLVAHDPAEMRAHLAALRDDPASARRLAERGRRAVLARHTCAHRVDELLAILDELNASERAHHTYAERARQAEALLEPQTPTPDAFTP